eukprot:1136874-Pelagomonas_calceolata.AAC.5
MEHEQNGWKQCCSRQMLAKTRLATANMASLSPPLSNRAHYLAFYSTRFSKFQMETMPNKPRRKP